MNAEARSMFVVKITKLVQNETEVLLQLTSTKTDIEIHRTIAL